MQNFNKIRAGFALAFALAFLAYIPALKGDFHFDDFHHIVNNPAVRNPPGWLYFFTHPESFSALGKPTLFRPLTMLSFALNWLVAEKQASIWLLLNVLLHALNAGLFFLVLLRWQKDYLAALLGGALFSVMAVLSQPVNYLSNRATLLAAAFILLGLLLDWSSLEAKAPGKILRVAAAFIFFWLGLLSKEIAAVFPGLVLLEDLFLAQRQRGHSRILVNAIYWLGFGFFLWMRWMMFDTLGSNFQPRPVPENLLFQARAVWVYLLNIFWPIHLSVLPQSTPAARLQDFPIILALAALVLVSALALVFAKRARLFSFIWLWFLVSLLPSSLIPLNVVMSEERLYLPAMSIVFGLVAVFSRAKEARSRPALAYACLGLVLIFQLGLLEQRIPVWRSQKTLWRDCIEKSPHLSGGYVLYGQALMAEKKYSRAFHFYQAAIYCDPKNPTAYASLCRFYLVKQEPEAVLKYAEQYFDLSLHPVQKAEALAYRAKAEFLQGNPDQAEKTAVESLSLDPQQGDAFYVLAAVSKSRGDPEQAEKYARQALEIVPDLAEAHGLLGLLLAQAGKMNEAVAHLQKFCDELPDDASGWFNLGMAYNATSQFARAKVVMTKAIELNGKYALAHYGMAYAQRGLGDKNGALAELETVLELEPEMVQAHFMQSSIFLDQLAKGIFQSPEARQVLLAKVKKEIKWLKAQKVDTKALEDKLKKVAQ